MKIIAGKIILLKSKSW